MKREIRVIQYGLGVIGSNMVRAVLEKKGMEIVGAIDIREELAGRDVGEVLGLGTDLNVRVSDDPDDVFSSTEADVVLHATTSWLKEIFPQIAKAIEAKANVISTSEQLSYPQVNHPEYGRKIDVLAKSHGVTVLGTGAGQFYFILILTLTGICQKIRNIKYSRTIDISSLSPYVQKQHFGVGLTLDEYAKSVEDGSITGMLTPIEMIPMVADALGCELDSIERTIEPITSKYTKKTPKTVVEIGRAVGSYMQYKGVEEGNELITFESRALLNPKHEGLKAGDMLEIDGVPSVKLSAEGFKANIMASAHCVNSIPHVIKAEPGLVSLKDLPTITALMGDIKSKLAV